MTGEPAAAADPCPDEAEIAEFVQGELSSGRAEQLEAHLDACESCGQVVAELVRIFDEPVAAEPSPGGSASSRKDEDRGLRSEEMAVTLGADDVDAGPRPLGVMLPAGATVGRYRVLDCVGVGGMGVVYAAYDPELDRRVALKLLRGAKSDPDSQARNARLLREAQALAKLTHPNVITVHDVGTWEGQVFVAMEFVDGSTLKAWMAKSHPWPEIREVFVAAGRGLAAAHDADLVHRDFKPDNVLIGKDGRVRVTDFGLARWGEGVESTADVVATDELLAAELRRSDSISQLGSEVSLTRTGTLVGTPAYMAPEQYEQRPVDAASDQYAFCVVLFEAIYGTRPFSGRTLAELASNVVEGQLPQQGREGTAPRAVRQAVRRGLSRRAADRFPSMNELLAVLDHRPSRRRWPWVVAGVSVVVGSLGSMAYTRAQPERSAFCRVDRGLGEVWSSARRESIRGAFAATGLSYAAETAERTLLALDEYVAQWEGVRARSCEPAVAAEDGPALTALRQRCLERRRVSLEALLEGFDHASTDTVGRAVGAVAGLPSADECGDPRALVAQLPPEPPPEIRDAVEGVRDELARVDGLMASGRYEEGLALSRELDARATELGHKPLQADTRVRIARLLDRRGEPEAAVEAYEEAALLATASGHRRVVARALGEQVYPLGVLMPRMDEAQRVARRAEAEIEGAGMEEALAAVLMNRGSVAYRQGDYAAASEFFRRAMGRYDREVQPLKWADAAFNLATVEMLQGHEDAVHTLADYLEVFEGEYGPSHPEVAAGYHNLGVAYYQTDRHEEAKEALERALEIRGATLGKEHPEYASTLHTLGSVEAWLGNVEEGVALCRRSVEIFEAHGSDPVNLGINRADLAALMIQVGEMEGAEREATTALETLVSELGPDHPALANAHGTLAELAARRGEADVVRRHMDRVAFVRAKAVGDDTPQIRQIRAERASMLARAGARDEAIAELRALLALSSPAEADAGICVARYELANILWDEPERRAEAVAMAREAQRRLRQLDLTMRADVVAQWLREHSP